MKYLDQKVQEGVDKINCAQPKESLRYKTYCQNASELILHKTTSSNLNHLLETPPSELQRLFQNKSAQPKLRTQAMLAYAKQIHLLPDSVARELCQHPYVQNLNSPQGASAADKNSFEQRLQEALQPSQENFDKVAQTLGHWVQESIAQTE